MKLRNIDCKTKSPARLACRPGKKKEQVKKMSNNQTREGRKNIDKGDEKKERGDKTWEQFASSREVGPKKQIRRMHDALG